MGIEIITILIVLGLLALMAIGIPLGVTTLTVSLVTAVLYFGERAGFFIVLHLPLLRDAVVGRVGALHAESPPDHMGAPVVGMIRSRIMLRL